MCIRDREIFHLRSNDQNLHNLHDHGHRDRHGRDHRGHPFSYVHDRHDRPLYDHLLFLHGHDHHDHQKYFSL